MRHLAIIGPLLVTSVACASARPVPFVGALGGVSTLSADVRSVIGASAAEVSLYTPENGPAANLIAGAHLSDFFSMQANYVWNRNTVTLASIRTGDDVTAFVEERRSSRQHAVVADALLYFRRRDSWTRPYLSVGAGVVRFRAAEATLLVARGAASRPPPTIEATNPALRVAVGMDLGSARGWSFRYSFSETIGRNPVSERLSPSGRRNLANFQNLFGVSRSF